MVRLHDWSVPVALKITVEIIYQQKKHIFIVTD